MDSGRVQYVIVQYHTLPVHVYNVYGWTSADCHPEAAGKTNKLFDAAFGEISCNPEAPFLILEDFNASTSTILSLQEASDQGKVFDLGAQSQVFGLDPQTPTCFPHGSHQGFRRDYIISSTNVMPCVSAFTVCKHEHIDVHAAVTVVLQTHRSKIMRTVTHAPPSLSSLLATHKRHSEQLDSNSRIKSSFRLTLINTLSLLSLPSGGISTIITPQRLGQPCRTTSSKASRSTCIKKMPLTLGSPLTGKPMRNLSSGPNRFSAGSNMIHPMASLLTLHLLPGLSIC